MFLDTTHTLQKVIPKIPALPHDPHDDEDPNDLDDMVHNKDYDEEESTSSVDPILCNPSPHEPPVVEKTDLVIDANGTIDTTTTTTTTTTIDQLTNSSLVSNVSGGCAICLQPYKVGDEICWSHNPHCVHAFHSICAQHWLLSHDDCPCCRNMYLLSPLDLPTTTTTTTRTTTTTTTNPTHVERHL